MKRKLLKPLVLLQWIMPWFVIVYGIEGLLFRRGHTIWGLPSTFWYSMGIITAMLVLLIAYLEGKPRS